MLAIAFSCDAYLVLMVLGLFAIGTTPEAKEKR